MLGPLAKYFFDSPRKKMTENFYDPLNFFRRTPMVKTRKNRQKYEKLVLIGLNLVLANPF